ncbi:hypothetical protein ACHAXR_002151 [Thalassiosira sp. AJA248-18]
MGEKALQFMSRLVEYSTWNFENKQILLQAEVHNLNGRYAVAELAYRASIASARDHKFINEEALAHEVNCASVNVIHSIHRCFTYQSSHLKCQCWWGQMCPIGKLEIHVHSFPPL